jgi:hypothetical protein
MERAALGRQAQRVHGLSLGLAIFLTIVALLLPFGRG